MGSAYLILLEIYSGVTVPKLYKLVDSQLCYCENKKRVSVFLRRSVGYVKITAVVRLSMQLSTARSGPSRTMYLGHSYLGHGQSHKIGPQGQGLGSRTTSLAVGTSRSSKVAKNHNALQRRDNCFATLTWTTDHKVLTNLANWNSLSFPGFPDPLKSLFHTIIKWKPDVTNHLSSQFGSFLAELQNILLKEHGDWLDPRQSLCHPTNLQYCYWQLCTQLDKFW